ncbi:MAG: hypothetical protein GC161_17370 [Planctomycetaceae bacterium]|nr:hypothetical protein [Planctomycetaceae bacterium]
MQRSTALRLCLSLLVAGLLLALLSHWGGVGLSDFRAALARLDGRTYALALLLHAGIYGLRSWRFALLLPREQRPGVSVTLAVSAAHNLASYVLPAKTGEVSLVLYLKTYGGVSASAGLASLLVSRLFDLAVLCAWVAGAVAWLGSDNTKLARLLPLVLPLGLLAIALAGLCMRPHWLSSSSLLLSRALRLSRYAIGRAVVVRLERLRLALRGTSGPGTQLACLGITAGQWALVFGFYAVLARGVGLPDSVGYGEAVFGSSLAVLFNLLPINGFAGFGTQELGWNIGFELLGVPRDLALASGLAVHLVQLANVVLFGLVAHLALGFVRHKR